MLSFTNILKSSASYFLKNKTKGVFLISGWKMVLFVILWKLFMILCPWNRVKWGMNKVNDIFGFI